MMPRRGNALVFLLMALFAKTVTEHIDIGKYVEL